MFFHDHVDALSSWGHGLFGAHIIEPQGSTFHDPVTGAPIDSGPIADIYTTGSAGFGEQGDFREFVLWQHEGITDQRLPAGLRDGQLQPASGAADRPRSQRR